MSEDIDLSTYDDAAAVAFDDDDNACDVNGTESDDVVGGEADDDKCVLVIGSDETRLIAAIEEGSFAHAYTEIRVENLKHKLKCFDAVIRYRGRVVWGFERKELGDMVSSMRGKDQRWDVQHADMQTFARVHGCYVCYVLEGHSQVFSNARGLFQGMPVTSLRSAQANKLVRDLVRVVRTEQLHETVQFLMEMAWAVSQHGFGSDEPPPREDAWKYIPIGKSERMTPQNSFRLMFAQVPGFGASKSKALSDHFRTPARFARTLAEVRSAKARVKLLSEVPGVGKKLSEALLAVWYGDEGADAMEEAASDAAVPLRPAAAAKKARPAAAAKKAQPAATAVKKTQPAATTKKAQPAARKRKSAVRPKAVEFDDADDDFSAPAPKRLRKVSGSVDTTGDNIVVLDD